jgi:hypothetical protein
MKRILRIIREAIWWYRDRYRAGGRFEHVRWAWRTARMSEARYQQAIAEGWRFEVLPGGQCNIYSPGMHEIMLQAPSLIEAIAILKLEHDRWGWQ